MCCVEVNELITIKQNSWKSIIIDRGPLINERIKNKYKQRKAIHSRRINPIQIDVKNGKFDAIHSIISSTKSACKCERDLIERFLCEIL